MPTFLTLVFVLLTGIYFGAYSLAAELLPQQTLTNLLVAASPLVIFTSAVLIALAFLAAQLNRIERRLAQLEQ